jgi:hypothetical protein
MHIVKYGAIWFLSLRALGAFGAFETFITFTTIITIITISTIITLKAESSRLKDETEKLSVMGHG